MQAIAEQCELCGRDTPEECISKHHLFPKSRRKRKEAPKGSGKIKARLCCDCHRQIHRLFSTRELAGYFNTIERLKEHALVYRFVAWIRTKKRFGIPAATKKRR